MSLRMKVGITQGTNKYKFIGFFLSLLMTVDLHCKIMEANSCMLNFFLKLKKKFNLINLLC